VDESPTVRNQTGQAALIEVIVPRRPATPLLHRPFRTHGRAKAPDVSPVLVPEVAVSRVSGGTRGRRGAQFEAECDRTTYSCGCGFVFQAAVLTSVACPHCGDNQAW
jgi:hypothetical protein